VNLFIEMSLSIYDGFLKKCDVDCPEYETLIFRFPKEGKFERIVQIRCDMEHAKSLLDLATEIHPAAVPAIEKAIAAAAIL
jgi:hypothetical protein